MADPVTKQILFGCSVTNINGSFGLNQNPTVYTITVVQEPGQTFTLQAGDTRDIASIELGELNIKGIIQSWEKKEIDLKGKNVFTIRVSDTKPILDAAKIFMNPSTNVNLGTNVIAVQNLLAKDIIEGARFSTVVSAIEAKTIFFGNTKYTVTFDDVVLPNRGTDIEYRIRGSIMSVLEFVQQAMQDHSLDWYVETDSNNIIRIKSIDRTQTGIDIDNLISNRDLISLSRGHESRDSFSRSVLIGPNKQTLTEDTDLKKISSENWKQFWGIDENGEPFSQPQFQITTHLGKIETIITTEEQISKAVNGELTEEDVGEGMLDAMRRYGNEFWGRKFYINLNDSYFDSNGDLWISTVSNAFWEEQVPERPDFLQKEAFDKFGTDDGRWPTFIKLPSPALRTNNSSLEFKWDDSLLTSPNVFIGKNDKWYMKARAEIIPKLEKAVTPNEFDIREVTPVGEGVLVLTLSSPLIVNIKEITLTDTTGIQSVEAGIVESQGTIIQTATNTKTRKSSMDKAWVAIQDKRKVYGPFSKQIKGINGKTQVIVDSNLTPWTFSYRDIEYEQVLQNMENYANARLAAITTASNEIDTADFEIAGLPIVNLGQEIGRGTNITNIQVKFSLQGITTLYKANIYTGELARHQRLYQDLLDQLRRNAQLFNNTLYPPQNYDILERALESFRNSLAENTDHIDDGTVSNLAGTKVLGRIYARSSDSPHYNLTPMAWEADAFGRLDLVRDRTKFGDYLDVVNMQENIELPGRLPIGLDVELTIFNRNENGITSYYINEQAPTPKSFTATIVDTVGSTSPTYKVEPLLEDADLLNLLPSELSALNNVLNLGEPQSFAGFLDIGTQVTVNWNEEANGTYTPYIEQQVNLFNPPS